MGHDSIVEKRGDIVRKLGRLLARLSRGFLKAVQGYLPQRIYEHLVDRDHRRLLSTLRLIRPRPAMVVLSPDPLWAFVLLQYNHREITERCIAAIRAVSAGHRCRIVVVDNGSTDGSGEALCKRYASDSLVHVILCAENGGFARGNDVGYAYAKGRLGAEFIVVINNDVIIRDPRFLSRVLREYELRAFSILAPDIRVVSGTLLHQNPLGFCLKTREDMLRFIERMERKLVAIEQGEASWKRATSPHARKRHLPLRLEGAIVPHGAAYVFSPIFIADFDEPFDARTFLYGEEDILALRAYARGHRILYSPKVALEHMTKSSTAREDTTSYHLARYRYNIDSAKVYIAAFDEILGGIERGSPVPISARDDTATEI